MEKTLEQTVITIDNGDRDLPWEIELGAALGYDTCSRLIAGEEMPLSLTEYKLPMHPFVIDGDRVHVTEFDLDEAGREVGRRTFTRPLPKGFAVPVGVSR